MIGVLLISSPVRLWSTTYIYWINFLLLSFNNGGTTLTAIALMRNLADSSDDNYKAFFIYSSLCNIDMNY